MNKLTMIISMALAFGSCQQGSKEKDPATKVGDQSYDKIVFEPQESKMPDGTGFFSVSSADLETMTLNASIPTTPIPASFDVPNEESHAVKAKGYFGSGPGLLFKITPAQDVRVTLVNSAGKAQERKIKNAEGFLPISFFGFNKVFPPSFVGRYELKITNAKGAPKEFSYSYSLSFRNTESTPVFAAISAGSSPRDIRMGYDVTGFVLAELSTNSSCADCIISVSDVSATGVLKKIAELPALPVSGYQRLSNAARFSGLLAKMENVPLSAAAVGNNSGSVQIIVNIPSSVTTVDPWCKEREGYSSCIVKRAGVDTPTWFRFINAVPLDSATKTFGGVGGILRFNIVGDAKITIKRGDGVVEVKKVSFDSGVVNALDNLSLPTWAVDDIRSATQSGAPEFTY